MYLCRHQDLCTGALGKLLTKTGYCAIGVGLQVKLRGSLMPPVREAKLPVAHRIFVDREGPQRLFENAAFSIPPESAIVRVFYGVGGQGKTELSRELLRKTAADVEPSYAFLRRALLDLHGRPKTDPDLLLVWIRNGFADAGVALPCFDLALALVWEGTRAEQPFPNLTKPWLGRVTKAAKGAVGEGSKKGESLITGEAATELIGDVIGAIPGAGLIFRRIGGWVIDKSKRAWLERTRDHLKQLYRNDVLKSPYELSQLLPWMLAQDLNYHLKESEPPRDCRRLVGLSYAAMGRLSMAAVAAS